VENKSIVKLILLCAWTIEIIIFELAKYFTILFNRACHVGKYGKEKRDLNFSEILQKEKNCEI
jgi:hypothetical protein